MSLVDTKVDTLLPILYRLNSAFGTKFLPRFAKSIHSIGILAAVPRQKDSSIVFWAPSGGPFADASLAADATCRGYPRGRGEVYRCAKLSSGCASRASHHVSYLGG